MMDSQDMIQPQKGETVNEKEIKTDSTDTVDANAAVAPTDTVKADATTTVAATEAVKADATVVATATEPAKADATVVVTATEPAKADATVVTTATEPTKMETIDDVLARLKVLSEDSTKGKKQEVDALKPLFYKLHKAAQDKEKSAFIAAGGVAEDFIAQPDAREQELKRLLAIIKEQKMAYHQELEKQKEANLAIRLGIIDRLKALTNNPEEADNCYHEVKELQQKWRESKLIPESKITELYKNYQLHIEQYYDTLKLNNEFREYDLRKNLEIKTRLCEAAEKLLETEDVISAFHQLQNLHLEFRNAGPIPKELREGIWKRFKQASTEINRRHQDYFEVKKEKETKNLAAKTVLCETIEHIDYEKLHNFSEWDAATKKIIALQQEWKGIGYAPRKENVKIFERFRAACDMFFGKKGLFFKQQKEQFALNLQKKTAICEQAEALKDSEDWKETSATLSALQKEWRTIGPVPKKHSESIWQRFITACDYFFEKRNTANATQHSAEAENATAKKALIAELETIKKTVAKEDQKRVREIIKEWNNIGHVPYREKDKLFKQFHSLVDDLFEALHINSSNERLNNFKSSIGKEKDSNSLYREREKLVRIYDRMKNEILTYENNIGFLTSTSKKGNSLVNEITKKVDQLKIEQALVYKKIEAINASMKEE